MINRPNIETRQLEIVDGLESFVVRIVPADSQLKQIGNRTLPDGITELIFLMTPTAGQGSPTGSAS